MDNLTDYELDEIIISLDVMLDNLKEDCRRFTSSGDLGKRQIVNDRVRTLENARTKIKGIRYAN